MKEFEEDKLSVLDVKAEDQTGAIYDISRCSLTFFWGRCSGSVFYSCDLYAGQLKEGDDYSKIRPVYTICLTNEVLWKEETQGHHAFRLTDQKSGRVLSGTLEIHTIELPRYTSIRELSDLKSRQSAGVLDLTGSCTHTNMSRKRYSNCFRNQRSSKPRSQLQRSPRKPRTRPCTMHARRRSETASGP